MGYQTGLSGVMCTMRFSLHTWCDCFEIERRDGFVLRLTGHDHNLFFRGQLFRAMGGADRTDLRSEAGLARSDMDVVGAISSDMIQTSDILAGLYNDAKITIWTVDWRRPWKHYMRQILWVDSLEQDGLLWKCKLGNVVRFLQTYHGRTYERDCDYVLGDPDTCRADISAWTFADVPVTLVGQANMVFRGNAAAWVVSVADDFYRLGTIDWTAGPNAGQQSRIAGFVFATREVTLETPTRFPIRAGDEFAVRPGCDGSATVCQIVFNNILNHGGMKYQRNKQNLMESVQ